MQGTAIGRPPETDGHIINTAAMLRAHRGFLRPFGVNDLLGELDHDDSHGDSHRIGGAAAHGDMGTG